MALLWPSIWIHRPHQSYTVPPPDPKGRGVFLFGALRDVLVANKNHEYENLSTISRRIWFRLGQLSCVLMIWYLVGSMGTGIFNCIWLIFMTNVVHFCRFLFLGEGRSSCLSISADPILSFCASKTPPDWQVQVVYSSFVRGIEAKNFGVEIEWYRKQPM